MAWIYLAAAILFEVAGVMAMKFSDGYSRLTPTVMVFVCYAAAFSLVILVIREIEISVAYTIWAGVGTTLIALIGIFYFGESFTWLKAASITLVVLGVVGLKLSAA